MKHTPALSQWMLRRRSVALLLFCVFCLRHTPLCAATPATPSPVTNNFAKPADLQAWEMDFPEDWELRNEGNLHYLHMKRSRDPGVPRRPLQFVRLKNVDAGSFTLKVKARRSEGSLIVVFNYVDTLHFYYAHISKDPGSEATPHNGIYIVDGGPRRRIAGVGSKPVLPDQAWHDVKIVRDVPSGSIQVFVDKESTPRFSVIDHTFTHGQVGLGSFDETGDFARFSLHAKQ
jgi:hypothetical protein